MQKPRPVPPNCLPLPESILAMTQPTLVKLGEKRELSRNQVAKLREELAGAEQELEAVEREYRQRDQQEDAALYRLHAADPPLSEAKVGDAADGDDEDQEASIADSVSQSEPIRRRMICP